MLIYIIIILLIIFLGYALKPNSNKKNKKIYLIIIFIVLAVVGAIRDYTVGVDTEQYCKAFRDISQLSIEEAKKETRYEDGFIVLCKVLSYICNDYQILIAFTSAFIMYAIGRFIYEESNDVVMSSLLFIVLNCYAMYLSAMRQALAISIILLGYILFLKKGKYIKYIIMVVIASLFHQSALIMIFLIFFYKLKFKNKYYLVAIILSVCIYGLTTPIFGILTKIFPTYSYYLGSQFFVSNYFASLLNAIVAIIFFTIGVYYNKFKDREKDKASFYAFMCMFNVIFYVATIKISIFSRITTYFNIFNIIWIPIFLSNISRKQDKQMVSFTLLLCVFLYWGIISVYRPEWYGVIPYKTFFRR